MVSYTQELTLDINTNTAYQVVSAKQGDTGSRWVLIHLTKNNIPYAATVGNNAQFRCRKPDGYAVINPAVINNDGTITVELTAQTLATAGRAYADVVESDGNGNVLSSVSFILNIMAAPDVAGSATSSDEFQKLNELVSRSDELIAEAEAWARGTKNNVDVGPATYAQDTNVTATNFNSKKSHLYTKDAQDNYIPLPSDAVYNSEETYYGLTVGDDNNAKYYSEQAQIAKEGIENLTVSATDLEPNTTPTANKTIDAQTGIVNIEFGIPQGIQGIPGQDGVDGERGPSTVWVGTSAPSDSAYTMWLNPEGTDTPILLTANQMSYAGTETYNSNTIGFTVKSIEDTMGTIQEVADRADAAADRAEEAAEEMEQGLDEIHSKITNPTLPTTSGFLYVTTVESSTEGEESTGQYKWKEKINYSEDLLTSSLPKINNKVLQGSLSLTELGIAPRSGSTVYYPIQANGIPSTDLASEVTDSLNLADTSVQKIHMNNLDFEPVDGTINLGTIMTPADNLVQKIHMNNSDLEPVDGTINLGTILTPAENTSIGKNYLDNPWFTVNQRGINDYNGNSDNVATTGTYICDRWKIIEDEAPGSRSINFISNILYISAADAYDATKTFSVGQLIGDDVWQVLSDHQVTASINFSLNNEDYQTINFNFTCPTYNIYTTDIFKCQLLNDYGWGLYITTLKIDGKNYLSFSIIWAGNTWGTTVQDDEIYIKSVKLELGITSTLDLEAAPIYIEELNKCQQYFRYYGGKSSDTSNLIIIGYGIASSETLLEWTIPFKEKMISDPTITSSVALVANRGFTSAAVKIGSISSANLAASTIMEGIDGLYLQTTATNLTVSAPYYIILPATQAGDETIAYLSFSAEP